MRAIHAMSTLIALTLCASPAAAQIAIEKPPDTTPAPSKFRSADDGWLDVSGFLDEIYGFLPVVIPITEPAGYGAAGGWLLPQPAIGRREAPSFGRPDITLVGGLGTENGSWGILAGDVRHWLGDRLRRKPVSPISPRTSTFMESVGTAAWTRTRFGTTSS